MISVDRADLVNTGTLFNIADEQNMCIVLICNQGNLVSKLSYDRHELRNIS